MGATWEERRIKELEAEVARLDRELRDLQERYNELANSKLVLTRRFGR
jgi:hypothetical protein